jgi:PEP-CTERM motif-containing protein
MLLTTAAHADTISYNLSTLPLTLTDITSTLTAQQFNPAFGTLQSVELKVTWNGSTVISVTVDPGASSPASGFASTDVNVDLTDPLGHFDNNNDLRLPAGNGAVNHYVNVAAGQTWHANGGNPLTNSLLQDNTYTRAGNLAVINEFSGTGNLDLNISSFTTTLLQNSGGNSVENQTTQIGASGQVIYTFDAAPASAPEPGTMGLLGLSLIGLGVLLRKRHAGRG